MSGQESLGDVEFDRLFSLASLRKTWRAIRKEIRRLEVRDVLDWLDWSVSLEVSLQQVRESVISGTYTPSPPTRYEVPKSKGSYRVVTALNIRDALVYRHICDHAYNKSLPYKIPGAYFSRRHSASPVGNTLTLRDDFYYSSFQVWMRYNEYRSLTLLSGIYRVLVVADISNYFDSISHDILLEYLAPLGLPRKAVGLLGRMLEVFKPSTGHSPNPHIGLPVDELDCSRELAHIFLFEHDHRIADDVGHDNYVRWMDDQNIGALDHAHGRRIINSLVRSLSTQRLTLNDGKTHLLSPDEVVEHFQLGPNTELTELERRHANFTKFSLDAARLDFHSVWTALMAGSHSGKASWDKILKRAYGIATRVRSPIMETGSLETLIRWPTLSRRLFQYFAQRNDFNGILALFIDYCASGSNLFEAVESDFFEALLLVDPSATARNAISHVARQYARGEYAGQTGRPLGRSAAILALYWHSTKPPILDDLYSLVEASYIPKEVARSWMVCAAALRPKSLPSILAALFGHPSDDVARMARFLNELFAGNIQSLGSYKTLKSRWPLPGKYYDARSWLTLDLASRSPNPTPRAQLRKDLPSFLGYARTKQETRIWRRVSRRLKGKP